jgi:hypothetical protein
MQTPTGEGGVQVPAFLFRINTLHRISRVLRGFWGVEKAAKISTCNMRCIALKLNDLIEIFMGLNTLANPNKINADSNGFPKTCGRGGFSPRV